MAEADIDGDGVVEDNELDVHLKKLQTQRRIAVAALVVMSFLGIYIAVFMPLARVETVVNALDFLWLTLGGVIATYMGAEAYVTGRK